MSGFIAEYFPPSHFHEGDAPVDLATVRAQYFEEPLTNLTFLLDKRFSWMNDHIPRDAGLVVEIGCGTGLTPEFVTARILLTDYSDDPWVEQKVDAHAMPFGDASVDVLITNNVIHHLAYPQKFFQEARRVLKPGGKIVIQEINASVMMRLILRVMRHEGYSFHQDPYDPTRPCNNPDNVWSANCAVPNLLFDDEETFERHNPGLRVVHQRPTEFLVLPLSGGVVAKSPTIPLPWKALRVIDFVDDLIVRLAPGIFALQRQVVVQKTA